MRAMALKKVTRRTIALKKVTWRIIVTTTTTRKKVKPHVELFYQTCI